MAVGQLRKIMLMLLMSFKWFTPIFFWWVFVKIFEPWPCKHVLEKSLSWICHESSLAMFENCQKTWSLSQLPCEVYALVKFYNLIWLDNPVFCFRNQDMIQFRWIIFHGKCWRSATTSEYKYRHFLMKVNKKMSFSQNWFAMVQSCKKCKIGGVIWL